MVLSVFMVQTLTTLLEPPPAIGGGGKGLVQPGQSHQPQANIAVFMFLFMLCAAEVVFIKLLALTSFGSEPPATAPTTAAASSAAASSVPAASSSSRSSSSDSSSSAQPASLPASMHPIDRLQGGADQEDADLASHSRRV